MSAEKTPDPFNSPFGGDTHFPKAITGTVYSFGLPDEADKSHGR